jgi:hypothetical protein
MPTMRRVLPLIVCLLALPLAFGQKATNTERTRVIAQAEKVFGPQVTLEHPGDDDVGFEVREDYLAYAKFNPDKTLNVMAFYPKRLERYPAHETVDEQMKAITQFEADEWLKKADQIKPLGEVQNKGAAEPAGDNRRLRRDDYANAVVRYVEAATPDVPSGQRWWLQSIEVFYPQPIGEILVIAKVEGSYVRYYPRKPDLMADPAAVASLFSQDPNGFPACEVEETLYKQIQKGDTITGSMYYDFWNFCMIKSAKVTGHLPSTPQKQSERK